MNTSQNIHGVASIKIENRSCDFSLDADSKLLWTHIEITDDEGNKITLAIHGDNVKQIPITMV